MTQKKFSDMTDKEKRQKFDEWAEKQDIEDEFMPLFIERLTNPNEENEDYETPLSLLQDIIRDSSEFILKEYLSDDMVDYVTGEEGFEDLIHRSLRQVIEQRLKS